MEIPALVLRVMLTYCRPSGKVEYLNVHTEYFGQTLREQVRERIVSCLQIGK
jgi:hypothetical protein